MKKIFLFAFSILLILSSCQPGKVQQGEITYKVTYPNSEISGFMKAILPETMTITFSGTKMKSTISRGQIFSTDIISDEADQSLEMRLDFGDKLLYTVLNAGDVKNMMNSQPNYEITALNQSDSLFGMFAHSYSVSEANDTIIRENAWFTEDLAPLNAYWFTSYKSVKGMPLVFDIERYGVMMHLEVLEFSQREVLDAEFDRDGSLNEIPYNQFEVEVQELFNNLME